MADPIPCDAVTVHPRAAIGICAGAVGLHVGVLYRAADDRIAVIHLAWHFQLRCDRSLERWAFAPPRIDPIELEVLSGFCALVEAVRPAIPYGFLRIASSLDDEARFVPGPGEVGLTCATFVMAMFAWARIALLDEATWELRDEDVAAQQALLELLRRSATLDHALAVEREVGCMRFRSEEVAAASTLAERPVPFAIASAIGARMRIAFDALQL
jgi:hypothetical protein